MRQPCPFTIPSGERVDAGAKGLRKEFSVRLAMLADLALEVITRHPLCAAGLAAAAALLSLLMTRARDPI